MDPLDVGKTERWYEKTVPFDRKINVPGAWNAQGAGYEDPKLLRDYEERYVNGKKLLGVDRESEKVYHVFPGPAWYRRVVTVPREWQGKVSWLKFAGVHRHADVWVNGNLAGSHFSYLTPFRFDIGNWVKPGEEAVISVRVDARRNKTIDPLMGCLDTLTSLTSRGGIYRKVTLEATARTWIEDLFVVPRVADKIELRLTTTGESTRISLRLLIEPTRRVSPLPMPTQRFRLERRKRRSQSLCPMESSGHLPSLISTQRELCQWKTTRELIPARPDSVCVSSRLRTASFF
jgi:hypothetical protein